MVYTKYSSNKATTVSALSGLFLRVLWFLGKQSSCAPSSLMALAEWQELCFDPKPHHAAPPILRNKDITSIMSSTSSSTENLRASVNLLAAGLDDLKAENAVLRQRIDAHEQELADLHQDVAGKGLS